MTNSTLPLVCQDSIFKYQYEGIHGDIQIPLPSHIQPYITLRGGVKQPVEGNVCWIVRLGHEIDPECEIYRGFYVELTDDYSSDEAPITAFGIDPLSKELAERYQIALANYIIGCIQKSQNYDEFIKHIEAEYVSWAVDIDLKEESGDFKNLNHVLSFILKYYNDGKVIESVEEEV